MLPEQQVPQAPVKGLASITANGLRVVVPAAIAETLKGVAVGAVWQGSGNPIILFPDPRSTRHFGRVDEQGRRVLQLPLESVKHLGETRFGSVDVEVTTSATGNINVCLPVELPSYVHSPIGPRKLRSVPKDGPWIPDLAKFKEAVRTINQFMGSQQAADLEFEVKEGRLRVTRTEVFE